MRNADVTDQVAHVTSLEHILHQAVVLVHVERAAIAGHDACRILAAVLEHQQAVIQHLVDGILADDTDNSAHAFKSLLLIRVS